MKEEKLRKQMKALNQIFHKIWFSIVFDRPDHISEEIKKMSFMELHLIGLAHENSDMIIKELREYLKVPQTTLSSVISRLEKRGYIRRVINHRDMRSFSIEVTPKGEKISKAHREDDLRQAKEALLALDENERDEFIKLMEKVGKAMNSYPKTNKVKEANKE